MIIETSPPINNSKYATEDSLCVVLKTLYDSKFESENEEVLLLKEAGRLLWMLAQIKFQGKGNALEFEKLMRWSLDFLRNAWNKKEILNRDLELKSQTEWLLGEHYLNIDQGKGFYFMYHSVIDMLTFHSKLNDPLKTEESKKLIQIWVSSLINMLMMGDCIDQAEKLLNEVLPVAKTRDDAEWELQVIDFQCLLAAFKKAKAKNGIPNLSEDSIFKLDLQKFYDEIKK